MQTTLTPAVQQFHKVAFIPPVNLMLFGPPKVGKTALQHRFANLSVDNCELFFASTYERHLSIGNPTPLCITIWDFNGGHTYHRWLRRTSVALFVFSIVDRESFDSVKVLIQAHQILKKHKVPIVLIGNKADLADDRQVSSRDAQDWCDENGIMGYFETSTKSGMCCDELLEELADCGLKIELTKSLERNLFGHGISLRKVLSNTGQDLDEVHHSTKEDLEI